MKESLTKKQHKVLNCLLKEIKEKGYPPSIREIGKALGISTLKGVTGHLDALERKGYIERNSTPRSIKILEPLMRETDAEIIKLPLVGRAAAGDPILAEQNIEDWISIPKELLKNSKKAFLLRVKGDSMTEDHILDGDLVIVQSQPVAENGDIVVAIIDGEATIKRFYKEKDRIRLQPANPKYEPITLTKDFQISGKVIGVIRNNFKD